MRASSTSTGDANYIMCSTTHFSHAYVLSNRIQLQVSWFTRCHRNLLQVNQFIYTIFCFIGRQTFSKIDRNQFLVMPCDLGLDRKCCNTFNSSTPPVFLASAGDAGDPINSSVSPLNGHAFSMTSTTCASLYGPWWYPSANSCCYCRQFGKTPFWLSVVNQVVGRWMVKASAV